MSFPEESLFLEENERREGERTLRWLFGEADVGAGRPLPFMACASRSALREADPALDEEHRLTACDPGPGRVGLSLVINDDHGMTPTVTVVNQTDEPITLRAVRPSLLATENGTYDLDALLAEGCPTVEPGAPLIFRTTDIGRNANEPFRVSLIRR